MKNKLVDIKPTVCKQCGGNHFRKKDKVFKAGVPRQQYQCTDCGKTDSCPEEYAKMLNKGLPKT